MLFTRCPECDTTFRVNDETLKKASGQVRCGRCASVFNAYAELHDPAAKSFEPEPAPPAAVEPPAAPSPPAPTDATASSVPSPATTASPAPTEPTPAAAPPPEASEAEPTAENDTAPRLGAHSVAGSAEQTVAAAAEAAADSPTSEAEAISATEVDRVLAGEPSLPLPQTEYAWERASVLPPQRVLNRWWSAAAALALVALCAQVVHHFRSEIAGHATFGPWLTATYAAFGAQIAPRWNVRQYAILDWIATAEPNARGVGSLKITARIQNRGPQRQPFPAVQLRLKDRWEAAVGSRMFAPAEYLPRDTPRGRLMSPGETARAEIEVVDPGPDAYGFELDVCIEVEASLITCGGDEVFL